MFSAHVCELLSIKVFNGLAPPYDVSQLCILCHIYACDVSMLLELGVMLSLHIATISVHVRRFDCKGLHQLRTTVVTDKNLS